MPSNLTLTVQSSCYDPEEFELAQRAFDGACWILGIDARAKRADRSALRRAKKLIANTVLESGTDKRDVQAMKTAAVLAVSTAS